ncbi:MAG: tRNA preQ1(34) S-adenosylmethionine ribosyltransferase-isomerase QueA [Proteobacteria bacterium]|nr:MAG: tRNA preQ1(34) S-adenosylmethionine ribosyltransferase-isomerase QueA [Pseudomonadota bacterium]PIE64502.1 MAG: tRNA preQ1(34) S-adenosylmethionine ribosyltransferase-isomerase QueA [Desulfobacterales bacterium]
MDDDLTLKAYHYDLPDTHIAQHPVEQRENARLMLLDRGAGTIRHLRFSDINSLVLPGDVLVYNNTKVFKARLNGCKETGGKAEVFLLAFPSPAADSREGKNGWTRFSCEILVRTSRKPLPGSVITISNNCFFTLEENRERGKWTAHLYIPVGEDIEEIIDTNGLVPLPPYIHRHKEVDNNDVSRYQTVYANATGAVAAPTAGLHFTNQLLVDLSAQGVQIAPITLHVGYGTFSPVEVDDIKQHKIHREYIEVSKKSAAIINNAKRNGGNLWAVGTTSTRTIEYCSKKNGTIIPFSGWCDLYIYPGYSFKAVDRLITNFHLPESSLMFLVSALCGRKKLLECYRTAIENNYRFFSYGDAMAII